MFLAKKLKNPTDQIIVGDGSRWYIEQPLFVKQNL